MPREPHSPNNASMNINWFKETRAIPKNGMEYFAYRGINIYIRDERTKEPVHNPNNILQFYTMEQMKEFADNHIRNKIL